MSAEGRSAGGRRNGLQGRYCFVCFFRPPDERKNPDWSDLMNYFLYPSDQRPDIQNHKGLLIFIFNKADKSRDRFELVLEETLRSLEENGIKFVLKAKQKKATERFYQKQIF